jgi:anaerobic ribonucleoside-triphosphate reductase activating protein
MNNLRYSHYDIVFQEVPNEVSLVFNISGCPYKCKGCHSTYLWDYTGNLLCDDFDFVISQYKDLVTCVCFMGGDQNIEELERYLVHIKEVYGLKTCIYSGNDSIETFKSEMGYLDYLKVGKYDEKLGGLDNPNTNQRFYKINNEIMTDITHVFRKQSKL